MTSANTALTQMPSRGRQQVRQLSRAQARKVQQNLDDAEQLLAREQEGLAAILLQEALGWAPQSADVHRLLAIAALMAGRASEALTHALAACAIAPQRADLAMLTGRAHKALNDLESAVRAYRCAIALAPRLAEAHVSLGIALKAGGDVDAAIAAYRAALAIDPQLAVAHSALGNALALQLTQARQPADGRLDEERLHALRRAVELDPRVAVTQHNLGAALIQQGRAEEALEHLNAALALDSTREESCILMHAALTKLKLLQGARECCERWLELNPPTAAVCSRLVTTLLALNEFDAALHRAEATRAMAPDMPEALHNLAMACQQSLEVPKAIEHLLRAIEVAPHYRPSREALMMSLCYVEEDPAVILQAHCTHALKETPAPQHAHAMAPGPGEHHGRLRIGYVSGDLRRHSVAYFMEPLLAAHDRRRFEVTAYHTGEACDEVTERLKASTSAWVQADGLSDDEFVQRIRADGIDVLIDLSGHTADGRLAAFGQRPAPVQMTYLGYPTTTGMGAIDYRISDPVIDPVGSEGWSSETVMRCEHGMFCYRPDSAPDVGPLPALHNGYVTFGSFNNLAKVSDKTLAMWAAALYAVPGSRLCLKARALSSAEVRSRLLRRFAALGIGPERLVFNPWQADLHSHLDIYHQVDIGLDTFPYNGATTTCESLWMGVPVVTLCGATHVSRMGASIMRSAAMAGWVATSVPEFAALAAHHAARLDALVQLRAGLREQLRGSSLMNSSVHCAEFESVILDAWARHGSRSGHARA